MTHRRVVALGLFLLIFLSFQTTRAQQTNPHQRPDGPAPPNPKLALRVLSQTGGMVDSLPPGEEQLRDQIKMALIYCYAKSDRGLAIMEPVPTSTSFSALKDHVTAESQTRRRPTAG